MGSSHFSCVVINTHALPEYVASWTDRYGSLKHAIIAPFYMKEQGYF